MMVVGGLTPMVLVGEIGFLLTGYGESPGTTLYLGLTMFVVLGIPIFGMLKLHRWAIAWYWLVALACIVFYSATLCLCLWMLYRYMSGVPGADPGSVVDILLLAFAAPGLWFLLKLVRDPWWQPWRKEA